MTAERVVGVTGASAGIGRAIALHLGRQGASVALASRDAAAIERVAAEVVATGAEALAVPTDVSSAGEAEAFIQTVGERLGRLDALVNNAGVMVLGQTEEADLDTWRQMVEVNLLGAMYCTRAALGLLRASGGQVINVASVGGRWPSAGNAMYGATKAGLVAASEALSKELAGTGVRVSVVEPGPVATDLATRSGGPAAAEIVERMRSEIGELLQPEDVAEVVEFILERPPHVAVNELVLRPAGQRW